MDDVRETCDRCRGTGKTDVSSAWKTLGTLLLITIAGSTIATGLIWALDQRYVIRG